LRHATIVATATQYRKSQMFATIVATATQYRTSRILQFLSTCKAPNVMHTPASAHLLGDTSDIVTINVFMKGGRTGGCNRPLWSLCVCPTLCTCAPVPSWWTAAIQPATRRAAWNLAALGAAVWAGFEPRARLRRLLRCRRAGWLPLRWCTPRAFTRKSLAKHVSRFARL
jgi:hypothetical protein